MSKLTRAHRWIGHEVHFSKRRKGGRRMVEMGVTTGRVLNAHGVKGRPGGADFILYEIEYGPDWNRKRSHFRREDFFLSSSRRAHIQTDLTQPQD